MTALARLLQRLTRAWQRQLAAFKRRVEKAP